MLGGVLTFAVAFAASWGLTVPIRRMALHWGIVDVPNARKIHRTPIPLLGGVAIYWGRFLPSSGLWPAPRAAKSSAFSRLPLYYWLSACWTTATCSIIKSSCLSPCPWRP